MIILLQLVIPRHDVELCNTHTSSSYDDNVLVIIKRNVCFLKMKDRRMDSIITSSTDDMSNRGAHGDR